MWNQKDFTHLRIIIIFRLLSLKCPPDAAAYTGWLAYSPGEQDNPVYSVLCGRIRVERRERHFQGRDVQSSERRQLRLLP